MNITLPAEIGDEQHVLLVPTKDGEYAKVGVVARSPSAPACLAA